MDTDSCFIDDSRISEGESETEMQAPSTNGVQAEGSSLEDPIGTAERRSIKENPARGEKPPNKKPVSARKQSANRHNSKRSTGPRTARGKSHSRMNSTKHGILARKTLFTADGDVRDPELLNFFNQLRDEHDGDDLYSQFVTTDLLIAYHGFLRALDLEQELGEKGKWYPIADDQLARFMTRHRKTLHQNFNLLLKLKRGRTQEDEEDQAAPEPQFEIEYGGYHYAANVIDEYVGPDYETRDYLVELKDLPEQHDSAATRQPPAVAIDGVEIRLKADEAGSALANQNSPDEPELSGEDDAQQSSRSQRKPDVDTSEAPNTSPDPNSVTTWNEGTRSDRAAGFGQAGADRATITTRKSPDIAMAACLKKVSEPVSADDLLAACASVLEEEDAFHEGANVCL